MAEIQERDGMNTIFFTNLQLLGMDVVGMEETYKIPFNKDMFNLPNKAGSEVVLHFLFEKLNSSLCRDQFRDCWPVIDRKTELQFRKICTNWLTSVQKDDGESHMPHVNAALLLSPGGRKFIHLLYSFSTYVLTQVMKTEHGWNAQCSINYPAIHPRIETLGGLVTSAIQDSLEREKSEFFEQLLLTVTANRKWKDYTNELVKEFRSLTKSSRDLQLEKRQQVNILAESSVKQGLSLPAKRTVTMFDSDQDTFAIKRGQRIEKAKSQWKSLTQFNDQMTEEREIFQSILDSSTAKHIIDGAELGVRVPGLLLRECSKEIHKREIDNVYNGGVLNLVSLVQLWNLCLNMYREHLQSETLPSVSPEVPHINKQVHKYHSHLRHTQELREKMSNHTLPRLMHSIMQLQKKLNSHGVSAVANDKNTNLLGLHLTAPTPPLMPVIRNSVNVEESPPGPVAGTAAYSESTPDALQLVTSKIEMAIQKDAETSRVLRDIPALSRLMNVQNRSVCQSRTNVPVSKTRLQEDAVKPGKSQGSTKPLTFKRSIQANPSKNISVRRTVPPETVQVNQNQSKSNATSNAFTTPKTSKQKAVDMLADTIVDSVLNSTDSTVLSDMSAETLFEFGGLGFEAFESKNMINRSPLESSISSHSLDTKNAPGGARPKTFAAVQRTGDFCRQDSTHSRKTAPERSLNQESVFSQNSRNTDSSCDSDSEEYDSSNNASVNGNSLLPNGHKSRNGLQSSLCSFNESPKDLHVTGKLSKTTEEVISGLSTQLLRSRTTSPDKTPRSSKNGSYDGDNNDLHFLNSLDTLDRQSVTHFEKSKEHKLQTPHTARSVSEGFGMVNSNLTSGASNSPDLLLKPAPKHHHSPSNSHTPRKSSYGIPKEIRSLHKKTNIFDRSDVSHRQPGDGEASSDQNVQPFPLVLGEKDSDTDTEETLDVNLNSLSRLSPNDIPLSKSDLLTSVYNRSNNVQGHNRSTIASDNHTKVDTDSVMNEIELQSQKGSELCSREKSSSSENLSHEQVLNASLVTDISKSGEKLIDFEDKDVPALVSLDSEDEDLESEQDLGDSFIPSKEGICLDSRSPAKLTPSRTSSQPLSRANHSNLSSGKAVPSLTLCPEDNFQAKLALLQQKALDILDKSSEDCEVLEDVYPAQHETINMTTAGPRSKDAGVMNMNYDEHDDEEDILSTEILNTDLLGGIEDLLS